MGDGLTSTPRGCVRANRIVLPPVVGRSEGEGTFVKKSYTVGSSQGSVNGANKCSQLYHHPLTVRKRLTWEIPTPLGGVDPSSFYHYMDLILFSYTKTGSQVLNKSTNTVGNPPHDRNHTP